MARAFFRNVYSINKSFIILTYGAIGSVFGQGAATWHREGLDPHGHTHRHHGGRPHWHVSGWDMGYANRTQPSTQQNTPQPTTSLPSSASSSAIPASNLGASTLKDSYSTTPTLPGDSAAPTAGSANATFKPTEAKPENNKGGEKREPVVSMTDPPTSEPKANPYPDSA